MTNYELGSLSGAITVALIITWAIVAWGATTTGGAVLGGVIALLGAVVLFYTLFRLDKWAKGL